MVLLRLRSLLGLRKRRAPLSGGTARRDPLDAVPVAPPDVRARSTPDGGLDLSRQVVPGNRFQAWMGRRLRHDFVLRARLDARGAAFWTLVDGRRTVREVAAALAQREELDEAACRQAVVRYVADLMRRGWLGLHVGA
jgi:hypothetical protein